MHSIEQGKQLVHASNKIHELQGCLARANALIAAQADENDRVVAGLQKEITSIKALLPDPLAGIVARPLFLDQGDRDARTLREKLYDADRCWYIWSVEHLAWWRPNEEGYTNDIEKAGRYTYKVAIERSKNMLTDTKHKDIAVPTPELQKHIDLWKELQQYLP